MKMLRDLNINLGNTFLFLAYAPCFYHCSLVPVVSSSSISVVVVSDLSLPKLKHTSSLLCMTSLCYGNVVVSGISEARRGAVS